MKTQQYLLKDFGSYFKRHKIATLDQLQKALGNPKGRTVFRKLKSLHYLSSYSHRGMYYTLQSIAEFNADGLWSHRAVWFSRFGSLLDTAKAFIEHSEAGYSAVELQEALHVETKHCLLKLVRAGQVLREKSQGCYVYFCSEPKKYPSQLKAREQRKHKPLATMLVANPDLAEEEAKAIILLFLSKVETVELMVTYSATWANLTTRPRSPLFQPEDLDPISNDQLREPLSCLHNEFNRQVPRNSSRVHNQIVQIAIQPIYPVVTLDVR